MNKFLANEKIKLAFKAVRFSFLFISSLAAVAASIVYLYDRFSKPDYNMDIKIEKSKFSIPKGIIDNQKLGEKQNILLKYIKKTNDIKILKENEIDSVLFYMDHVNNRKKWAPKFEYVYEKVYDKEERYETGFYKTLDEPNVYITVELKNIGQKSLEDLHMRFPYKYGFYEYRLVDKTAQPGDITYLPVGFKTHEISDEIPLRNLDCDKTILVEFWTSDYGIFAPESNKLSITHKNGEPFYFEVLPNSIFKRNLIYYISFFVLFVIVSFLLYKYFANKKSILDLELKAPI